MAIYRVELYADASGGGMGEIAVSRPKSASFGQVCRCKLRKSYGTWVTQFIVHSEWWACGRQECDHSE
jgi:hypothetical protein